VNKLEEIQERLRIYKETDDSHYIDDVGYLLSIIEQQVEEIEHLKVLTCPACGEGLKW
jgi:hypothetical protein